jgi:2-dehydro-3-deoxyglucarate aldolase
MIETATALENLDAILDVPELGFVFVGPSDLSIQLGHPGDRDHPAVTGAIAEIEETALDADVPLAGISHDVDGAHELVERGYRVVRLGGDLEAARQVLGDRLERLNERRGASS